MFCNKCGAVNPDAGAAFCSVCGNPLSETPQVGYIDNARTERTVTLKRPTKFKPTLAIVIGALVLIIATGAFFGGRLLLGANAYKNLLSDAEKAAAAGDYVLAVSLYRDALNQKPDDPDVPDLLDAALTDALAQGLDDAKAMAMDGRISDAQDALSALPVSRGDRQYSEYQKYIDALRSNPSVWNIDTSAFPTVFIYIDTGNGGVADRASVTDGGKSVAPDSISGGSGRIVVEYTAEDSPDGGERRDVLLDLTMGEFTFPLRGDYITPEPRDASVTLVSTDFSDYPTVRAFFRVEDLYSEEHVDNVGPNSFKISESVSGGAFVAREVTSAERLDASGGKYGLNISLVADKSDSIGSDMSKIKTVMHEFIGSLALGDGDKAELIAFDDVPQLMCTFTGDKSLLTGGINNMAIDGMTAFYDAVYQGVRNAALQGGARCVIAFTDGEDNMSRRTANDVIRFALEKQVPLYIIGVGNSNSSSHDTLREMAYETNGQYWYIDDLYDLTEIYAQIYGELQDLYVVSYESDGSADPLSDRGLEVAMRGGGYRGGTTEYFSPSKTAGGGGASRYEIFVEDVTWEQANERCLERGGHLVTITSRAEEEQIIALAEASGVKYVWLGGYTSYDSYSSVFGHWITGEDFTYSNWMQGEPSRSDRDGTPEWYLMLWKMTGPEGWCWNDQRNELIPKFSNYIGNLAYVCEYEV